MQRSSVKAMETAARLENDLRASPVARLPSLDELARAYGTSRVTMHKAVRLLCARGILDARPGRGIVVAGASTETVQSKAESIGRELRSLIVGTKREHLPSIVDLSRRFHVSSAVVRAALGRLEKEGFVSLSHRRRTVVCHNADGQRNAHAPAAAGEPLYQRLRSRIESGAYPSGQPLPKFEYLTRSEHVGVRTVVRAFRRIERDGLVYRKGRTRFAGAPGSNDTLGTHGLRRCVLILQPNDATWDEFAMTSWTMPFAHSFMHEMSLYGVEPVAALERTRNQRHVSDGTPSGKLEIARFANRLGDRLLGILIVNRGWTVHDAEFTRKSLAYSEWLCGFGKPVVLFDHLVSAQEQFFDRRMRAMLSGLLEMPGVKRHFTRCYQDIFTSLNLAILILHRDGHRTVGYPTPRTMEPWMAIRGKYLRDSGGQADPPVRVLDSTDCPPLFDMQGSATLRSALSALSSIKLPFARRMTRTISAMGEPSTTIDTLAADQKESLELTAYLGAFLASPDVTGIVAPNDEHARLFYRWSRTVGLQIPEDLSLLSFDDRVESAYPYTISSINFGFDSLGYTAFHAMLGDIPVKTDTWRSVAAKCRINHYATLGRARA